ncbi:Transcription initiation factor TFIID subunit 7 [Madurella mycetomatis]|uniref:Transcription initiation factor TFIID subunit 7 n=1 Tax=Madurella mycetomatis TaxID=100816 RepID=A0A175W920_9PEZI|nr:Transcription initiation factor TFIID subunit 7 [Madurella mycetomatis]
MERPLPPQKRLPSLKITNRPSGVSITAASPSTTTPSAAVRSAGSPAPQTPSQGPMKIKILARSQPPTPADGNPPTLPSQPPTIVADGTPAPAPPVPVIKKTKAGRLPKPSAKKRARDQSDEDDDVPLSMGTGLEPLAKKTKITLKPLTPGLARQPTLKVKPVGRVPQRPLGEGYDSEAEDREVDPVIEEQFLFRMMPGEHCEYLRKAIQEKKIGVPKSQGGADIQMKFLDEEGRRAFLIIQGQPFAAILLDLPTITEGMKTWDKKSMVKSSDICQMLLVFAKVQSEEEAKTAPLPKAVEHGHRWPHGITPPMHDARNRRFRKRLSKLEIKNKEAEVERLLAADREALSVRTEWIDNKQDAAEAEDGEEYEEYEEDAEGEMDDYFGDAGMEQRLEEEFEVDDAALEAEFLDAVETPAEAMDLATPAIALDAVTPVTANTGTPAAQTEEEEEVDGADEEESEEDDEDVDEDGDDDGDDDGDEDRHDELAGVRNEITNLKKQLKMYEDQLANSFQPIMRKRIEGHIRNVKSEILLKMSAIGEAEED